LTASRIHLFLAGLMGGGGVALWAMAAHRPGAASLVTAAQFLLFHACAVMGITVCRKQRIVQYLLAILAVSALILGTILFAGDIVMRSIAQAPLFTAAAPIGGSLTILGWLMLALAAVMTDKQS
jgi:uncharacterized membrane protein YgdD (TMEM256/DUF423 family)